jgi:hypothetical protein
MGMAGRDGIRRRRGLAPFSQFHNLAYDPSYVKFSANSFPDSGPSVRRRAQVTRSASQLVDRIGEASLILSSALSVAALGCLVLVTKTHQPDLPAEAVS